MAEVTPAFFVSLSVLLITIGSMVWALSSRLGNTASKEAVQALEIKIIEMLAARAHASSVTHAAFATKAELESVESQVQGQLKEFRGEVRENMKELSAQQGEVLRALTNLATQVTSRRA